MEYLLQLSQRLCISHIMTIDETDVKIKEQEIVQKNINSFKGPMICPDLEM